MNKKRYIRRNWYWSFFFLFIIFLVLSIIPLFRQDIAKAHYNGFTNIKITGTEYPLSAISVQYKSESGGFFVGDKIKMNLIIQIYEINSFNELKNQPKENLILPIPNSESPNQFDMDISIDFGEKEIDEATVNGASLTITKINESTQTIYMQGDVIFNREGILTFLGKETWTAGAIGNFLKKNGYVDEGVYISPKYAKIDLEINKRLESLTFVTIAVSFLSLFIALFSSKQKSKTQT